MAKVAVVVPGALVFIVGDDFSVVPGGTGEVDVEEHRRVAAELLEVVRVDTVFSPMVHFAEWTPHRPEF